MLESLKAIVLKTSKFSESSKIAILYAENYGKLSVLAKGAFKPKSNFAASLQVGKEIEANIYIKTNRELHTISNASIIKNRNKILLNSELTGLSMLALEFILKTSHDGEYDSNIYKKLSETLDIINNSENPFYSVLKLIIIILERIGFAIPRPELNSYLYFSTKKGKFYAEGPETHKLTESTANKFKLLLNNEEINVNKSEYLILFNFLCRYLNYHLDKEIKFSSLYLLEI